MSLECSIHTFHNVSDFWLKSQMCFFFDLPHSIYHYSLNHNTSLLTKFHNTINDYFFHCMADIFSSKNSFYKEKVFNSKKLVLLNADCCYIINALKSHKYLCVHMH